jgi:biotin operon repressor
MTNKDKENIQKSLQALKESGIYIDENVKKLVDNVEY